MRISRMLRGLLVFPLGMFGCSQPWGVRPNPADGVRTVASVGDRSLPIRSGTPDSSVQAGEPEPLLNSASRVRISGRVYDERGKPVPGAKVRLAVGGEPGGKALVANTDPSGAFTLRGLRSGSSYTLIAEYQGQGGALLSGRLDTEAPDTNVRISLKRRVDEPLDENRSSVRPARSGVAPISSIEEVDDAEDAPEHSPRANREDLEPPAPEAEEALRDPGGKATARLSAAGETPTKGSGWTSGHPSRSSSRAGQEDAARPRPQEGPLPKSRGSQGASIDEEDEVNPLPPALDPGPVGSSGDREEKAIARARSGREVVRLAVRPPSPPELPAESGPAALRDNSVSRADTAPEPLSQGSLQGGQSASSEAYAPIILSDPKPAPRTKSRPAGRRSQDSPGPEASLSRKPAAAPQAPAQEPTPPKPTWGELVFAKKPIPLDESIKKASRDAPSALPDGKKAGQTPSVSVGPTATTAAPGNAAVTCQFDPVERTLKDFRLPDAQGRMVAFHDIDADLILIDFWGTWCVPCRKSIPHLNEIQKTLGGKKMQVIGIACERTPAKDRAAKVAKAIQDLKIQYPVLITTMNGLCPVQEAFQVQFYPTMVLLDRQGHIIWREQGATDVTLARMDRFILKNLHRGGTSSETRQARSSPAGDDQILR
jgi:thiol-disulfide isomerase/thioredoxin